MSDDLSFLRKPNTKERENSDADAAIASLFSMPNVTRTPTTAAATTAAPPPITATAGVSTPRTRPPGWAPPTRTPISMIRTPTTVNVTTLGLPTCTGAISKNNPPITATAGAAAYVPITSLASLSTATTTSTLAGGTWNMNPGSNPTAAQQWAAQSGLYNILNPTTTSNVPTPGPLSGLGAAGGAAGALGGMGGTLGAGALGGLPLPTLPNTPPNPPGPVDPFGRDFGPATATLNTQNDILMGADIINWRNCQPATELEFLLTKQALLNAGAAYQFTQHDVLMRIRSELANITGNQWASAISTMQQRTMSQTKRQSSILGQKTKLLVACPTLGNNHYTNAALKSLQLGLQKRKLYGNATDVLDFSIVLLPIKQTIETFGFNQGAAYLLSKEAFGGALASFLSSCNATNLPYEAFWRGIQGTLIASRSPSAILSMITRLKSTKPNNLVECFNSIFSLNTLYCNITDASEEETFRSTRQIFFEILRSFYQPYQSQILQEDGIQMSLLKEECERLLRLNLNPMDATRQYHPVLGILTIVQRVIGLDGVSNRPSAGGHQRLGAHPRPGVNQGQGYQGEPQYRFRRPDNKFPINQVEADAASTRADSPRETPVLPDDQDEVAEPETEEERGMLDYYTSLQEELEKIEIMAVEKKFKSFPSKFSKRQGNDDTCFICKKVGHWKNECPEKMSIKPMYSTRKPKFESRPPHAETLTTDVGLASDLTVGDLGNFTGNYESA